MKSIMQKFVLAFAAMVAVNGAFAQYGPQWGATQEEQQENVITYNVFRDAYNNKDYPTAIGFFKELVAKSPKGHSNIYIYTGNIYSRLADQAEDPAVKDKYVDSLMMVYDLRIEHFGDAEKFGRKYITRRKAEDYLALRANDKAGIKDAFDAALKANGTDTPADFVLIYFNELTEQYLNDMLERDEYLAEYDRMEKYFTYQVNVEKENERKTYEALLVKSGAADCNAIEDIFRKRFEENPEDLNTVSRAAKMLIRGKCEGDFYVKVITKWYDLDPSSNTAMLIASNFESKKDYANASKYLKLALGKEQDPLTKNNLNLRLAAVDLAAGNSRSAAEFARKAIEISPDNGYAYILLAQAYGDGAKGCSGFDRQSVYWLAVDVLSTAQRSIKNEEQLSKIASLAASYRSMFPSKEECFFRGLSEGSSYRVNCGWVSGTTIVRTYR